MDAEKIGKGISFLRRRYGFTQRHLAELLHISDKAVSKWERGLSVPDVSLLSHLAQIFDTDIESLLEGNLANFQQDWQGELVLDYPPSIHADTLIYDKPAIFYQLSYFMLAGITCICVLGNEAEAARMKVLLNRNAQFGLDIAYGVMHNEETSCHTMRVTGLPFIYGKDFTKIMRRILYGTEVQTRLTDVKKNPLGITFIREISDGWHDVALERGTIAFTINNYEKIFAAAGIVSVLAKTMGENIADLREIAIARNLLV